MKIFLLYKISDMPEMTLPEIKATRDSFKAFTMDPLHEGKNCWLDYGVDGEEVYRIGVIAEGGLLPHDVQRIQVPKNEQGILGGGVDVSIHRPLGMLLYK